MLRAVVALPGGDGQGPGLLKRPTTILLVLTATLGLARHPAWAEPARQAGKVEAEARDHFKRAEAYRDKEVWREALREYRQSLALKKTKGAMASAAVCLRAIGQYDEALDQYEELRREFPVLPAAMEAKVAPAIAELQHLVGTLVVSGDALAGATLFVDERRRGILPLAKRLRLAVGTHTLRVEKEGCSTAHGARRAIASLASCAGNGSVVRYPLVPRAAADAAARSTRGTAGCA